MISKVNDSSAQMIQQYQKIDSVKNEGEKPITAGTTIATERVDLSAKAKDIQRIKQVLDQTPEVRQEKVQELKSQIENGSYAIDSGRIADKMLGESLIDIMA
jgi:negative regulator of flagellin synthesis FlgM